MMHDIGKVLVPEFILSRPRRPTRFERFVLNLHPNFGALLASYYDVPSELRIRTQHHQERWDGRGCRRQLRGVDIQLMRPKVPVTGSYDPMVALRGYDA